MNLSKIVKETEKLGVTVIFCPLKETKGRHISLLDNQIILINQTLTDIEKVNVLLHERMHFINQDTENILSQSPTFSHYIESEAETSRIIDFMNLINTEYPIDESFNYIDYMKNAFIPAKFENLVKEEANKIFKENKKKAQ